MSLGVPAEPPDLVLAVGRGGVSVQDPVRLGQAESAGVAYAGVGLLLVNYLPINCIFSVFIFQRVDIIYSVAYCVGISHNEILCSELKLLISDLFHSFQYKIR